MTNLPPDFDESVPQRAWRRWTGLRCAVAATYHWNRSVRLAAKAQEHRDRFQAAEAKVRIALPGAGEDDSD